MICTNGYEQSNGKWMCSPFNGHHFSMHCNCNYLDKGPSVRWNGRLLIKNERHLSEQWMWMCVNASRKIHNFRSCCHFFVVWIDDLIEKCLKIMMRKTSRFQVTLCAEDLRTCIKLEEGSPLLSLLDSITESSSFLLLNSSTGFSIFFTFFHYFRFSFAVLGFSFFFIWYFLLFSVHSFQETKKLPIIGPFLTNFCSSLTRALSVWLCWNCLSFPQFSHTFHFCSTIFLHKLEKLLFDSFQRNSHKANSFEINLIKFQQNGEFHSFLERKSLNSLRYSYIFSKY